MTTSRKVKSVSHLLRASIALAVIGSAATPHLASAHGYSDFPKARQAICNADGGYWDSQDGSTIPNAACRAAFLEAGTFQFVQAIEFSTNVANYNNINAVKNAVPNGLLCAAGASNKRGIDVPHPAWPVQDIQLNNNGTFQYRFYASTPHDPSFWEFYLSKPGFDPTTETLTWNDLELVDEKSSLPLTTVNGRRVYQGNVALPTNRNGRALLYVRWQRQDPGGEGFYNCSDINIGGVVPPTWNNAGNYVSSSETAEDGDTVWFRIFNSTGAELVFTTLDITATNTTTATWANQLAATVNSSESVVQIGKLNNGSVSYDNGDVFGNQVFVNNSNYTYQLDIKKPTQTNTPPTVTLPATASTTSAGEVTLSANASDADGDTLSYNWTLPAGFTASGTTSASITATAPSVTADQTYTLSVQVSDGSANASASTQVTVTAETTGNCNQTDPNAANVPAWVSGQTYNSGDQASYNGLVWKAKWWTNSGAPSNSNSAWELLSDVPNIWSSSVGYAGGSEVHHNGGIWVNSWWTQGSEPGVDSVWTRTGNSSCQ